MRTQNHCFGTIENVMVNRCVSFERRDDKDIGWLWNLRARDTQRAEF